MAAPILLDSGIAPGLIRPEEFDEVINQLPRVEGFYVPEAELGRFIELTVVNHWQGTGGPWRFRTSVQEEHLFGRHASELGVSHEQVHVFPEGDDELIALAAIRLQTSAYGRLIVSVECDDRNLAQYFVEIRPPAAEIDRRR